MTTETLSPAAAARLAAKTDKTMRNRLAGISYARAAGVAVGAFMIGFAPFNHLRWGSQAPEWLLHLEFMFFIAYGILLVMPWSKLGESAFRFAFGLLITFSVAFGFLMVADLMFQFPITWNHVGTGESESIFQLVSEKGEKPSPPAFQGMLIFGALLQLPTVLFARRPQLLG